MTVSVDSPFIDIYCDSCSTGYRRVQTEDKLGALFIADREGWDVDKGSKGTPRINRDHICPDCVEDRSNGN